MYNESFKELNDTLRGIADNIENLPEYSYGLTIDDIVVFVVMDGRNVMDSSIFQVVFQTSIDCSIEKMQNTF